MVVVVVVSNASRKNNGCHISLLIFSPFIFPFFLTFFKLLLCFCPHIFIRCLLPFISNLFAHFYYYALSGIIRFQSLSLSLSHTHTHTYTHIHARENLASLDSVSCLGVYCSVCGLSRLVCRQEGKVQGINFMAQEPTDYRIPGNVVLFLILLFIYAT